MSGSLLEKPDTTIAPTDTGDHDAFAHYYPKKELDRAIFEGIPATALCGKKDIPLKGIEGRTVCPECKEAWEAKDAD